jgi:hypothetical protein
VRLAGQLKPTPDHVLVEHKPALRESGEDLEGEALLKRFGGCLACDLGEQRVAELKQGGVTRPPVEAERPLATEGVQPPDIGGRHRKDLGGLEQAAADEVNVRRSARPRWLTALPGRAIVIVGRRYR